MNYNELSRPLEISDVDFRVQSINNGGYATILAYKDARVDMNRLDEVLSPLGWQRDYKLIDGKLFCGVGIYHAESSQWIWKWDVGTESMTEAQKGQASDAFKRACFNLGIGRELYDYPLISVRLKDDEWTKDGGRPKQTFNLKMKDWRWYSEFTDGKLTFLAAKDQNGDVRFKWGTMAPKNVEPSYKQASVSSDSKEAETDTVSQKTVVQAADESNVSGLLKKTEDSQSTAADLERLEAVADYEAMFGKKPHGKMSTVTILNQINEESERRLSENLKEEEEVVEIHVESDKEYVERVAEIEGEPEEIDEEPSVLDLIDEIQSYNDPGAFVGWAKSIVSEWTGKDSEENLATFKDMCNDHYSKISK
jgi:hypothetical protein